MSDYNLGTARGRLEIDASGAEQGAARGAAAVQGFTGRLQQAGPALVKVGAGVTTAGAAIAGGFAYAVSAAAKYEKGLSAIQAVSGASRQEMDLVNKKALQLGKDTSFSASEAAGAIEELVKAGISIPDVMNGAADATVALAAAGEIDLPQAATIASNAMNQFGLSAKQMPKIADAIAGAANASAIDVGDFGQSLQQVGAVANLAGVSFQDTAVAIAEMGNAGIKGSDAGTSLKTMFSNLQPQTQAQIDTFKELGLATFSATKAQQFLKDNGVKPLGDSQAVLEPQMKALIATLHDVKPGTAAAERAYDKFSSTMAVSDNIFYDAQGNLKSLKDVQEILRTSTSGLTAAQKQQALGTLFGSDAIRAAAVLTKSGAAGYDKMATSMGKVTAAEVAATRQDNLAGKWEQMKGSLETIAITVGQMLLPALQRLVEIGTSVLNWFLNLSPQVQKTIVIIIAIIGVILLVVGALITFAGIIGTVLTALAPLAIAIGTTAGVLLGWLVVIPIIIAAVVALVVIIVRNWDTILAWTTSVWNAITAYLSGVWASITTGVMTAWNGVLSFFTTIFSAIGSFFTAVWGGIAAFFSAVWAGIVAAVTMYLTIVWTIITTYVNLWRIVITTVLNAILAIWNAIWGMFGPTVMAVWELIKAVIALGVALIMFVIGAFLIGIRAVWTATWNVIKSVTLAVWNAIKSYVTTTVNSLRNIISAVMNAIRSVIMSIWNAIKGNVFAVLNAIRSVVSSVFNAIRSVVSSVMNAIRSVVSSVWNAIRSVITSVVNSVRSTVSSGFNAARSAATSAFNGMRSAVSSTISAMLGRIRSVVGSIRGVFSGAAGWLVSAGRNIIQGLLNGINGMIHSVTDKLRSLTNMIPKLKGPPKRDKILLEENGELIMKGLINGIDNQIPALRKQLGGITLGIPSMAPMSVPGGQTTAVKSALVASSQSGSREAPNVTFQVYNPVAEKSSQTAVREMSRIGALGVMG